MDYRELSQLISFPWIDTEGIMKINNCSRHTATKIRKEIEEEIIKSGKKLPASNRKHIPTKLLLDYLGLQEDYIFNMARKGEENGN